MIIIEWVDGFPCISLPTGIVLLPKVKVKLVKSIKPNRHKDFSNLQQIKEDQCYNDLLEELKKRFKDKKDIL
ncbi:MAG: hypothetical protein ACW972_09660 [Promethearchaeota archaeon]